MLPGAKRFNVRGALPGFIVPIAAVGIPLALGLAFADDGAQDVNRRNADGSTPLQWAVFEVAIASGAWPVVIVGVATSVVTAYFYVYVIVVMFFRDPEPGVAAYVVHPSVLTSTAIAVGAAATLVLGVVPGPVLNLAGVAGQFLR